MSDINNLFSDYYSQGGLDTNNNHDNGHDNSYGHDNGYHNDSHDNSPNG